MRTQLNASSSYSCPLSPRKSTPATDVPYQVETSDMIKRNNIGIFSQLRQREDLFPFELAPQDGTGRSTDQLRLYNEIDPHWRT